MSKHRIQNYWGGFCTECGGTGRSKSGCSPCSVCKPKGRDLFDEMQKSEFGRLLIKLSTQMEISKMDNPDGLHTHICEKCRFKWQHKNSCINDVKAHTCRECGSEQWGTDSRDSGGELIHCAAL